MKFHLPSLLARNLHYNTQKGVDHHLDLDESRLHHFGVLVKIFTVTVDVFLGMLVGYAIYMKQCYCLRAGVIYCMWYESV